MNIPFVMDAAHRRGIVGNEPLAFHCHHYNAFLQRAIRDAAGYLDSTPFLVGAAAEVSWSQLRQVFAEQKLADVNERKRLAAELYRWAGFGTIDLGPLTADGGTTSTEHSHYASSWRARFGPSTEAVCFFAQGWIAGALAAIYDLPRTTFTVAHPECGAIGPVHHGCLFSAKRQAGGHTDFTPVGVGTLSDHAMRPVPPNNVDAEGIFQAVSGLPLVGDATGDISAFGVHLTRHYANYYNRVSFEFLRNTIGRFGAQGRHAVEPLLEEAGHVCAFHTFGGIMTSTEWDALIRPNLKSKEDWIHGVVAVINALGWGRWQVTAVSEKRAEFVLHDDYESVGHLAMYGKAEFPVAYMAQGVTAGLMNLVYIGDIASRPELSPSFYQQLFKQERGYVSKAASCKATGDDVTVFETTRS